LSWERLPSETPLDEQTFTRRRFVVVAGMAGASAYVWSLPGARAASAFLTDPPAAGLPFTFSTMVRRREDFISLRFDFFNLVLNTSKATTMLVQQKRGVASAFAVVFGPQHIADEAFLEAAPEFAGGADAALPNPGGVRARLAGESRLGFNVPAGVSIPYTLNDLLTWAGFTPNVVPVAVASELPGRVKPKKNGKIRAPDASETSIELPWNLALSPHDGSAWAHATDEVTHGGRTELWHTRLGVAGATKADTVDEENTDLRTVRAVWAFDLLFGGRINSGKAPLDQPDVPFLMPLDEYDRYQIVRATSDYSIQNFANNPLEVDRLMLSALGGWLDSRGSWDPVSPLTLVEWRHRASQGRDGYVRVVNLGYLFPFGHKAVKIKVSERKFHDSPSGKRVAYLRERFFIVVKQPVKDYGLGKAYREPHDGRAFPFRRVQIKTLTTPNLQIPAAFAGSGLDSGKAWQPQLSPGTPFLFHMIGTDWVGNEAEFTAPVIFVDSNTAFGDLGTLIAAYNVADESTRRGGFQGQSIAIAKSDKAGDTSVDVQQMLFGAEAPDPAVVDPVADPKTQPHYFPTFAEMTVRLGPAEQASGGTVKSAAGPPTIVPHAAYVINGSTKGGVFAELKDAAPLDFPADKSGGVATPNFGITALSKTLGPVGGPPATISGGSFDPSVFFGDAKLLGGVLLADIVHAIADLGGLAPPEAMKITYSTEADQIRTHVSWKPTVKGDPLGIFEPGPSASLDVEADFVTNLLPPNDSTFKVDGSLRDFKINLVGSGATQFMILSFTQLRFSAEKGKKSHVDVDIANVEFAGVLEFVEELSKICAIGGGDGSGPSIDLSPTGITAKLAVPIPSISVGVFALENLAFSAGINIPFSGDPVRVRFAFSERADPFHLTISMFSGGGFFGLALGADGIELVEASFEFGASVSISIGVASGGVHIYAGIYFSYGADPDNGGVETCVLTGYVRLGGELDILGLISMSLEFYMSITYEKIGDASKVSGQATLTVEVEVFVFSASVSMTAEKHFGNAPGDPTFAQLMPASAADANDSPYWDEYCAAFGAVGAHS
jgi:hypothetical protein